MAENDSCISGKEKKAPIANKHVPPSLRNKALQEPRPRALPGIAG